MKKIVFIAALLSFFNLQFSICQAQFGDYGVKVGVGSATIVDDLSTKSPVLGLNVGGYVNYTFAQSESVLAEIFYLQSGLNLIRRGSHFEEVREFANDISVRQGHYYTWYAQVPILAGVHMELPIRQAGHIVGIYLGPAVSVGLFGDYADRKVTPFNPSYAANYDVSKSGSAKMRDPFSHINRLDVSAVLGVSYEYHDFTFSLFLDHGLLATSEGEDVLRIIENSQATNNAQKLNVKIPNGNNNAVMVSVAYRLGTISK